jgi:hypothetical protein
MAYECLLKKRALVLLALVRQRLVQPDMVVRHRRCAKDFTRERVLTFPKVMLFVLQKSLKSLQTRLHEFFWDLAGPEGLSVEASAMTHARAKLKASAFVELNQTVLQTVYGSDYAGLVQRWRGHRLLAIDSSLLRLPSHASVGKAFGWVQCANHHGLQERYPQGRVSVLYDVLNEVALDSCLVGGTVAETELAHQHLAHVQPGDVLLTDRGYTGYGWLAAVQARGAHFVSRCSRGSFAAVQQLFARNEENVSVEVTLLAPRDVRGECQKQGWPLELRVRLVTVRLSSGELEVLATSLLDPKAFPTEELAKVYWQRWGQETFYGRVKGQWDLEHCSGKTQDAVEQDFAATMFLSNMESVLIGPAQAKLEAQTAHRQQPAQVNRAVSVHALKYRLIELLSDSVPIEQVLEELTLAFQANPVSQRPGREVKRRKFSASRSYHYQRRVKKISF